jgi:hypothetical protein
MIERCPYCRETIEGRDATRCPSCGTPHHQDCFAENGGCTVFGCESAPPDAPKIAVTSLDVSTSAPPPPLSTELQSNRTLYFVHRSGEQFGPYSLRELQQYIAEGRVALTDFAWSEGMPQWVFVSDVIGNLRQTPAHAAASATIIPATDAPASRKPDSYMISAVLVTLFCCIPFGIVSIVYASQVDAKFRAGDYRGAEEASKKARQWYHAALGTGIVIIAIYILGQLNK